MKSSGTAEYRSSKEEKKDELEPAKKRPKVMPASQSSKQQSIKVQKKKSKRTNEYFNYLVDLSDSSGLSD